MRFAHPDAGLQWLAALLANLLLNRFIQQRAVFSAVAAVVHRRYAIEVEQGILQTVLPRHAFDGTKGGHRRGNRVADDQHFGTLFGSIYD